MPPDSGKDNYELRVFQSGCVQTRPENLHDWFNALVWLAFPRTKARVNAIHAETIPREGGRRGRLRDLLTIFDEGGALVVGDDAELIAMLQEFRWKDLFWSHRQRMQERLRFVVLGHAVLEQALKPWPGITCKAIVVPPGEELDAQAAAWLAARGPGATPRDLAPLPIFGYPGWMSENAHAGFYDDARYFRLPDETRGKPGSASPRPRPRPPGGAR